MKADTIITLKKTGRKLRDFPAMTAVEKIRSILERCHSIRGSKPKEGETSAAATELYAKLKDFCGYLTVEEIENAARDGVYSNMKNVIPSPAGIFTVIREYMESDEYQAAVRKMNAIAEDHQLEASKYSDEDNETSIRKMIKNDFDHFLECGNWRRIVRCMQPRGTYCYDYLVKTGRLEPNAWKGFAGIKDRAHDSFSTLLNENVDTDVLAKALCYTNYIEQKAIEKNSSIIHSEDLPQ